jgi:integrase
MPKKPDFPLAVRRGSVTVQIYKQTSPKGYEVYLLSYYEDGLRKRPSFANLNEARKEAEEIAERLARGEVGSLVLRDTERLEYLRAHEFLDPLGIPLDFAANEYAQARGILHDKASLLEAVRFFVASNAGDIVPIQTADLVNHLIETRKQNHASKRHVQDLRSRLTRFAKAFACEFHKIRSDQIQDFLTRLKLSPRSINNYRTAISNLFSHARLRRHVSKKHDPLAEIPWAEVAEGEVSIYTPIEFENILKHARVEMVPYLVIGAFAGIRQAELAQLDWKDVKADHIVVRAAIAKEGTRRHAPIPINLQSWLQKYRQQGGRVVPFANVSNQLCRVIHDAGLRSKHNGLRHSFGSFRLAIVKDPAQVAYEMGNSVQMVFKHYRKVVEESEAQRWFAIVPESCSIAVPRQSAAAPLGLAA